jgi:hypothetical protein
MDMGISYHACSFFADADVLIFLAAPPTITLSKAVWLRVDLILGDRLCF